MYQVSTIFNFYVLAIFNFFDMLFIVLDGACLSFSPEINNVGIIISCSLCLKSNPINECIADL